MQDQQTHAIKALIDKIAAALNDLAQASPEHVFATAESIRDDLLAIGRETAPQPGDPQWQRARQLLDRYQFSLNQRLNQVDAGLQALGIGQPIYNVPGQDLPRLRSHTARIGV